MFVPKLFSDDAKGSGRSAPVGCLGDGKTCCIVTYQEGLLIVIVGESARLVLHGHFYRFENQGNTRYLIAPIGFIHFDDDSLGVIDLTVSRLSSATQIRVEVRQVNDRMKSDLVVQ